MKKNLFVSSIILLASISGAAANCDFKIVDRYDQFNSSVKSEIAQVLKNKGYTYSKNSETSLEVSSGSDFIGASKNVFISMTTFVRTNKGESQRYPVGQKLQCGLATDYKKIAFLGGANGAAKKLINEMDIPSCQELPAIIEQCLKSYSDKN